MARHRDERFFASTRGRVVTLLRRSERGVEDLARALGFTDNGVRAHAWPPSSATGSCDSAAWCAAAAGSPLTCTG